MSRSASPFAGHHAQHDSSLMSASGMGKDKAKNHTYFDRISKLSERLQGLVEHSVGFLDQCFLKLGDAHTVFSLLHRNCRNHRQIDK